MRLVIVRACLWMYLWCTRGSEDQRMAMITPFWHYKHVPSVQGEELYSTNADMVLVCTGSSNSAFLCTR
jgi:hypothetical protein